MSIEIKSLTLGIAATNCYIVGDTETGEAILIDPVDRADLLYETAQEAGWTIKLILATHGHFDHVLASKPLKELTGAPFYIHKKGNSWIDQLPSQGVAFTGKPFPPAAKPDRLLPDNPEPITVAGITLEAIFTPGHSDDHLSYFMREQNILFGGDCLFHGSIGRVDLPYADYNTLMDSIMNKILPLGDEVQLLAGHLKPTTLGHERQTNPFILDYLQQQL